MSKGRKEIILIPAYGRTYRTSEQVIKHWIEGKDFLIQDVSWPESTGRYTSIRDFEKMPEVTIKVRYGGNESGWRLPNVCFLKQTTPGIYTVTGVSDGSEGE